MRALIIGAAVLEADAFRNRSFCKTVFADIPSFCQCTDVAFGGRAACHVDAGPIEDADLTLKFEPCGSPPTAYIDFTEELAGLREHFETNAGYEGRIAIEELRVDVPRLGNATAVADVSFQAGDGHLQARLSLDACGTILGREGCGSDIPFSPLPFKVINIDRDLGDFCQFVPIPAAERTGDHSFCNLVDSDIPSFCECSDTSLGGTAKCRIEVGSIDSFNLTFKFEPCGAPATAYFDFADKQSGVHTHVEQHAGYQGQVAIDQFHVNMARFGDATAVADMKFYATAGRLQASLSLDACGTMLGRDCCGSEIPFLPLPFQVIDIDQYIGDFCESESSFVSV